MFRFPIAVLASVLAGSASAAPLDIYENEAWPLLVFAPSEENAQFEQQRDLISREFGKVHEHEIAPLLVAGDEPVVAVTGEAPPAEEANAQLRQSFRIGEETFTVILVDLEGDLVERWNEPVDLDDVISLVGELPGSATITEDTTLPDSLEEGDPAAGDQGGDPEG